jgi:hypothetical protein
MIGHQPSGLFVKKELIHTANSNFNLMVLFVVCFISVSSDGNSFISTLSHHPTPSLRVHERAFSDHRFPNNKLVIIQNLDIIYAEDAFNISFVKDYPRHR